MAEVIEKKRSQYFSYLKKFNSSTWHSEQRILYDIDNYYINNSLFNDENIKLVIACVHTRLFPCNIKQKFCNCYSCLKNWPEKWLGNKKNKFLSMMTVSYCDDYDENLNDTEIKNNFFIKKFIKLNSEELKSSCIETIEPLVNPRFSISVGIAQDVYFFENHIVFNNKNFFEMKLQYLFKNILLQFNNINSIQDCLSIESTTFSLKKNKNDSFFIIDKDIKTSDCGMILWNTDDSILQISNRDNDWILLLKSYVISKSRSCRDTWRDNGILNIEENTKSLNLDDQNNEHK